MSFGGGGIRDFLVVYFWVFDFLIIEYLEIFEEWYLNVGGFLVLDVFFKEVGVFDGVVF